MQDIDESNEWLLGKIDEELQEEEDYVFGEDDGLTWSAVARASGADEPIRPLRRATTKSPTSMPPSRGTKRPIGTSSPSIDLDDKEKIGSEDEEEDCEGLDEGDAYGGGDIDFDVDEF